MDLVFLLDGSGSIRRQNFEKILKWLKEFVTFLEFGPNKIQMAIVSS